MLIFAIISSIPRKNPRNLFYVISSSVFSSSMMICAHAQKEKMVSYRKQVFAADTLIAYPPPPQRMGILNQWVFRSLMTNRNVIEEWRK